MVFTCFLCKWRSDKLPRRSYHKFPSANELKQKWLNILGKSDVSIGTRTSLCSMHFDENCFRYGLVKGRKILKDGSLPTLHLTKDAIESQTINLVDKVLLPASLHTESTLPTPYSSVDVIQMEDVTSKLDIEGKLEVPMEISMGSFHKRGLLNLPSKENEILYLKSKATKLKRSVKRSQHFKHNKNSQLTVLKKTCAYEIDKNLMHASSSTGDTADARSDSETSDASSHQETSPNHENLDYWKWLPEAQTEDKNTSTNRGCTAPIPKIEICELLADAQNRDRSSSTTEDLTELNKQALQVTVARIEANPQLYIGIPKNCYHLVELLHKRTRIPTVHILLCLKKVKLDTQFEELADQFGILASQAKQIFVANIPLIANTLRSFIVSLDNSAEAVRNNLPIPFRNNHLNATCIVVSLELKIQPNKQAKKSKVNESNNLTQTENGNTVKYLISTSPDGFIDYVSPGYGGRISDEMLIEDAKCLDKLKPGSCIVTKAFRNVEQILANRGLHLLRPGGTLRAKSGLILSDKVKSSLEDHVDRVLQRLSEFSIVNEHSAISSDLVSVVDDTIVILCALINLQSFFIN